MMTEGEFGAFQFIHERIKVTAAQSGTKGAGGIGEIFFGNQRSDVKFDGMKFPVLSLSVIADDINTETGKTGVKSTAYKFKWDWCFFLQFIEDMSENKTVFAAG